MTRRSQRSTHRSRQSAAASSTVHADSTPLVDSPVQHSSVQHSSVTATTTLTPPRVFFRYLWADFVRTFPVFAQNALFFPEYPSTSTLVKLLHLLAPMVQVNQHCSAC